MSYVDYWWATCVALLLIGSLIRVCFYYRATRNGYAYGYGYSGYDDQNVATPIIVQQPVYVYGSPQQQPPAQQPGYPYAQPGAGYDKAQPVMGQVV